MHIANLGIEIILFWWYGHLKVLKAWNLSVDGLISSEFIQRRRILHRLSQNIQIVWVMFSIPFITTSWNKLSFGLWVIFVNGLWGLRLLRIINWVFSKQWVKNRVITIILHFVIKWVNWVKMKMKLLVSVHCYMEYVQSIN